VHRIKIVHIALTLGGIKTYLHHLLTYSTENLFEYVIIAPENSELQEYCNERKITYYVINNPRNISPLKDISALFKIRSILKSEKPDIIHTHSAKGGYLGRLAAKFSNIKVVYTPHAFSYLSFKGIKRMAFYMLEYYARNFTDVLLAVSHSEAGRAINELGYDSSKVHAILNSIPVDNRLPFRNYHNCNTIGMIGRLTFQKNPFLFLQTAVKLLKKYPHLKFSILGAGVTDYLSAEINEFIKAHRLENKVTIHQWGTQDTSKKFLEDIDVFVLTSVYEGLPYSLVEAMSSGIPCVVSKADGNTDVVQNNENGFSCLSMDEFYEKLLMLIESEELRRKFGQAGHRYIHKRHDIQKNILQLEDLYRSLSDNVRIVAFRERKGDLLIDQDTYRDVSPKI